MVAGARGAGAAGGLRRLRGRPRTAVRRVPGGAQWGRGGVCAARCGAGGAARGVCGRRVRRGGTRGRTGAQGARGAAAGRGARHGPRGGRPDRRAGVRGELVLVPVPSARHRVRARGHDPGRRIALAASARLRRAGVPARVAPVLRLRRAVADQAGLGARERRANLAGALEVSRGGVALLARGPRRRRRAGRAGPGSCSWTMWSPPAPRSPRRPGRCARRGSARWPRRLWSPLRRARSDGEIPPATRTEQKTRE